MMEVNSNSVVKADDSTSNTKAFQESKDSQAAAKKRQDLENQKNPKSDDNLLNPVDKFTTIQTKGVGAQIAQSIISSL